MRQENEAIAYIMIDKMKKTPDLVSGLSIKGRGHSKKLTLAVLDIPSVFVRGYKKPLKVFEPKWKKDGTKIMPDQFLNLSKKNVFLVLGLANGHSIGVNLKEKHIWDPNFSQAQELSLENLDICSGGDYIGVEQVGEIYFRYPK